MNPIKNSLRFFKRRPEDRTCRPEQISQNWAEIRCGGRSWENYYRRRWQYDKVVRSTHGVNCTGSCSWDVYVKDGIIVFDTQKSDYPGFGPDMPDHEPRGCPRGASYTWYTYSPIRVKYPYIRSNLLQLWRQATATHADPVEAWRSIAEDPEKRSSYQRARGKGGLVRTTWEESSTLIAASLVYTIEKYGPDRIFGFTPIPAMSMVCYASGARFLSLIGASMLSFYDWYCDLPPASPQVWGEQTDVPESADWYNASYMIVWGTNLPMTRSPDAHFYTEARYRGARVAAVAPDYAEYVKFADTWLPARAGTDAALAMAMTQVVLKEYYIDRKVDYFTEYVKRFTDLPFLVILDDDGRQYLPGRFLRASDLSLDVNNSEWKTVVYDAISKGPAIPNGSIGFRWNEKGRWNLNPENSVDGKKIDPLLSFAEKADQWVETAFPLFEVQGAGIQSGQVPVKRIRTDGGELLVTTVFDLMKANLGLAGGMQRGAAGDAPENDSDPRPYTPAWQEKITGVPAEDCIRVAREFADNAEKTRGKSMIFLGAGTNHWYHSDMTYRAILNLTTLCGCQGVNGGGWAHYVGQEKVRPLAGWAALAFGLDWLRPPRQQNGTSFYYFASDQWRYESFSSSHIASPLFPSFHDRHLADYNVIAARLGWLPFYPQFNRNPLSLCREAVSAGALTDAEIVSHTLERVKDGEVSFSAEDPDAPENHPRILFLWRANLLGASGKGHEYLLKHLLGVKSAVFNQDSGLRPEEIRWREAPEGKLDLLVTSELRMSTSALYADVVLPAAGWYEMHDISSTDMHTFIHPFNPAIDPPWETKTNWDQFKAVADKFSILAEGRLGKEKDLVSVPLFHDTPAEIAQPAVWDWKKGEIEPVPGKTFPNLIVVERDYTNAFKMMTALGPLISKAGLAAKGIAWKAEEEYEELKERLGTVREPGVTLGMPSIATGKQAAEAILTLAPETNSETAKKSWQGLQELTGIDLTELELLAGTEKMTFASITARPQRAVTSPIWSGIESEHLPYAPFVINVKYGVPFRTLTGRAQFYQDHEWMRMFGESLPVYRPPLDMQALGSIDVNREPGKELILNYLTPHSKWSIHSSYSDTLIMLTLFRGGEAIWINDQDAAGVGIKDNDWVECFNVNGLVMAKAVVSHRIPPGKAFMYHAQERLINTPGSKRSGQRGGTHNSVTRIWVKPTLMIGGYAQLSYGFNYYGPIGAQRDEVVIVRKADEVDWYED